MQIHSAYRRLFVYVTDPQAGLIFPKRHNKSIRSKLVRCFHDIMQNNSYICIIIACLITIGLLPAEPGMTILGITG